MTVQAEIESRVEHKNRLIRHAIEELRPFLRADGGDCELVDVDGDLVSVRMTGACMACQFSSATIAHVQDRLVAATGMSLRIARVPSLR